MNCWDILGIKPTDNLKEIKRAYASKSREVHPEEHPEEFKQLHEAYEQSTNFAKSKVAPPVASPQPVSPKSSEAEEVEEEENLVERVDTATVEEQGYVDNADWRAPINEEDENFINFDEIFQKTDLENNREIVRCSNLVFEKFREFVAADEKSDEVWISVFKTAELGFAAGSPYFLSKMTDFVKENEKLPKCFYRELSTLYRLDAIATRERQGVFEELIATVAERKSLYNPAIAKNKRSKVNAWFYIILFVSFAIIRIMVRTSGSPPMWVYWMYFAFAVIFIISKAIEKRRNKKAEMSEEDERIHEVEKKQRRAAFFSMGPIHHIMKPTYYSRLVLGSWAVLSTLGFLQIMIGYEDYEAVIAMLAWVGGGIPFVLCLLVNIIIFMTHKKTKKPIYYPPYTDLEKKQKKNAFIVLMCIVAFFVIGAIVVV